MIFKRRQLVSVVMIAVVLAACYVNYRYRNTEEKQVYGVINASENIRRIGETRFVNAEKTDSFSEARLTKTKARDERMELIDEVLSNAKEEEKKSAYEQKLALAKNIESEAVVETILNSKGFENVLVTITEQGATVSVQEDSGITGVESAKITESLVSELGLTPDKIKIIEIKP